MLRSFVRFFNLIHIGMVILAKVMIVAMVCIIFVNVVLRYAFSSGLMWSEEIALLLAIWFSFLAMAIGVKQGLHIHISLLPSDRLPKIVDAALTKLASIVVIIVAVLMLIYGWKLVGFTMKSIMPATKWPAGLQYAIVPPAAILMILDALATLVGIDTNDAAIDRYLSREGTLAEALGDSDA